MKRIFLSIPSKHSLDALYPPVGLLYLAAMARNSGHYVKVVDGQIVGDEALISEFASGEFEYFGTTILTPLREESYKLIRRIKSVKPECITIVGGAHVSILPEQTMGHVPEIDIAVVGEGEETLLDILSGKDLGSIPGIWYRRDGRVFRTPYRAPIDTDRIPVPAWDLIDITKYKAYEEVTIDGKSLADKPFLTIFSSRGCKGRCSFCSTWWVWRKWRQLPVKRFADEIEYLYRKGVEHFFIADDSMVNDGTFVEELANELLVRNIKIHCKVACRADKVTKEIVRSLKTLGCYEVHVGFESGSQKILDTIGKELTIEDNLRAAKLIREAGMKVYALLIIGSMHEDISTINETIRFLKDIKPDVIGTMGGLMLLPGTRDFRMAVRKGLLTEDYWLTPEKFNIYDETFSRLELSLISFAVRRGIPLWSNSLLYVQLLVPYAVCHFRRKAIALLAKAKRWCHEPNAFN
jgi:anaerobic magnesium-protoporphyrin IX monomethyl ester cyclase